MYLLVSAAQANQAIRQSGARLRVFMVALCLVALAPAVSTAAIYKSIDSHGNVIFTDQPSDGAESVASVDSKPVVDPEDDYDGTRPKDPNAPKAEGVLVAPQPIDPPESNYTAPEEPTRFLPVTSVEILTPIHDTTLHDPIGKIWVELQSFPTPLKKTGLIAQLWMDDQLVASGQRPMLSLPIPERGTHVLQVKLIDDEGRLFLQSEPTHVHVKFGVRAR